MNLARRLIERGRQVHTSTPQRWADRNSIPGEYWSELADMGIATLDELASAAAQRLPANDSTQQGRAVA